MPTLKRQANGVYHVRFRFCGFRFHRSLSTTKASQAAVKLGQLEQSMELIEAGILELPEGITADQLWRLLWTTGKQLQKTSLTGEITLEALEQDYFLSYPEGSKEASTLATEKTHIKHFKRLLGDKKKISQINAKQLRSYVHKRQGEKGLRGRRLSATTINKELETFRLLWDFAKDEGYVRGTNPCSALKKPRRDQKPPFQTYEQIALKIERSRLDHHQAALAWDCLFLRIEEVMELLDYVRMTSHQTFVYPMFAFIALTGARRSEMMRSELDDIQENSVFLREKKRRQDVRISYRSVDLCDEFKLILADWAENHPGGYHTFVTDDGREITPKLADKHFKLAIKGSKWEVVPGFHCLRHSFASIRFLQCRASSTKQLSIAIWGIRPMRCASGIDICFPKRLKASSMELLPSCGWEALSINR